MNHIFNHSWVLWGLQIKCLWKPYKERISWIVGVHTQLLCIPAWHLTRIYVLPFFLNKICHTFEPLNYRQDSSLSSWGFTSQPLDRRFKKWSSRKDSIKFRINPGTCDRSMTSDWHTQSLSILYRSLPDRMGASWNLNDGRIGPG